MSKALLTSRYNFDRSTRQQEFQRRNKIQPSFHGAVFVVEDIWVQCSRCSTPVDPVSRVPVGRMFFHPHCLRCVVCDRPSRTQIFKAVDEQPVCQDCYHQKFKVPKDRTATSLLPRGVTPGSSMASRVTTGRGSPGTVGAITLGNNLGGTLSGGGMMGGLSPSRSPGGGGRFPSLTPAGGASPSRGQLLLEQQQRTQQADPNLLVAPPPVLAPRRSGSSSQHTHNQSSRIGGGRVSSSSISRGGAGGRGGISSSATPSKKMSVLDEQPALMPTQALM